MRLDDRLESLGATSTADLGTPRFTDPHGLCGRSASRSHVRRGQRRASQARSDIETLLRDLDEADAFTFERAEKIVDDRCSLGSSDDPQAFVCAMRITLFAGQS